MKFDIYMVKIMMFSRIALIIFLYYVTYYFYIGILHPVPAPGDSWDYHMPISKSILDTTFIHPDINRPLLFYPGSSEAINSLFMLLHVPLTISNLFAILVLFFTCWKLALVFQLKQYYALLFALTFCTLNVIVRWFNAVSIDVWVAVFFCLSLILLQKPRRTSRYFFLLGLMTGMLIGSKYTAISYILILGGFYGKRIFPTLNVKRIIFFAIPFSIFGVFWYIRNYIIMQNPIYPLCILSLKCKAIFSENILTDTRLLPLQMFNAGFGEYKLWILAPLIIMTFYLFWFKKKSKEKLPYGLIMLSSIGFCNLFFFLFYPTTKVPWIMVSSFRYSFPTFIPLMLCIFIIASYIKKEVLIGYFAIANMISVLTMAYNPKLVLFYLPLSLVSFYCIERFVMKKEVKRYEKSRIR